MASHKIPAQKAHRLRHIIKHPRVVTSSHNQGQLGIKNHKAVDLPTTISTIGSPVKLLVVKKLAMLTVMAKGQRFVSQRYPKLVLSGLYLCILGFLIACTHTPTPEHPPKQLSSTTETKIERFIAHIRTRVRAQYPAEHYFIGIGHANTVQGASTVARAELTRHVRVHVTSQFTIDIREQNGITDQQIVDRVKTTTAETLREVEHVEQGTIPETPLLYAVIAVKKTMISTSQSTSETQLSSPKESQPNTQGTPVAIWVTVQGQASFGTNTTPAEVVSQAKDNARRQAIEKAVGTFVQGRTLVYNSSVAEDLVTAVLRGIIVEEEWGEQKLHHEKSTESSIAFQYYTIPLRAKVQATHPEHRSEIKLFVALNRDVFKAGEEATITVKPTQDVHVYIFNISQDDTVTVLFPNRFSPDTFVEAHTSRTFPSQQDRRRGITLQLSLPNTSSQAIEKVKVIATTRPHDLISGSGIQEGIFQEYSGKESAFITALYTKLGLLEGKEWAEKTIVYEVRE